MFSSQLRYDVQGAQDCLYILNCHMDCVTLGVGVRELTEKWARHSDLFLCNDYSAG